MDPKSSKSLGISSAAEMDKPKVSASSKFTGVFSSFFKSMRKRLGFGKKPKNVQTDESKSKNKTLFKEEESSRTKKLKVEWAEKLRQKDAKLVAKDTEIRALKLEIIARDKLIKERNALEKEEKSLDKKKQAFERMKTRKQEKDKISMDKMQVRMDWDKMNSDLKQINVNCDQITRNCEQINVNCDQITRDCKQINVDCGKINSCLKQPEEVPNSQIQPFTSQVLQDLHLPAMDHRALTQNGRICTLLADKLQRQDLPSRANLYPNLRTSGPNPAIAVKKELNERKERVQRLQETSKLEPTSPAVKQADTSKERPGTLPLEKKRKKRGKKCLAAAAIVVLLLL